MLKSSAHRSTSPVLSQAQLPHFRNSAPAAPVIEPKRAPTKPAPAEPAPSKPQIKPAPPPIIQPAPKVVPRPGRQPDRPIQPGVCPIR